MTQQALIRFSTFMLLALAAGFAAAQSATAGAAGSIEHVRVHGRALAGNLEGDDATRDVFVYLPPGYAQDTSRRYPVVYFLHGYTATAQRYVDFVGLPAAADAAVAAGGPEMIVVLPDAYTKYGGSMYSNSPTIGNWEHFIARDLVEYVDAHYRTLARRSSRGLGGHSMGGYGTLRIGMKHADVFGALYAMSACCLLNEAPSREAVERQIAATGGAPAPEGGFANALMAQAAAWAPNPDKPPHFFDWPYEDGQELPLVKAKWAANSPLLLVDQYVPNLQSFAAIAIDIGDADPLLGNNERLDEALSRLGIAHDFEIYEGDHVNRIGSRFAAKVVPFFARTLAFE
jgi:S-formylglutathione hydrolase FrmB